MDRRRMGTVGVAGVILLLAAACTGAAATPTPGSSGTVAPSIAPAPSTAVTTPSTAPTAAPTAPPERNPAAYVEGAPYDVTIDPADFVAVIDNPYWPLIPGTTTVFDGGGEHIVVEVTDYTKTIMGIPVDRGARPRLRQGQAHRGHVRLVRPGSPGQRLVPR